MTEEIADGGPKRTAVLVVHGMGLQRPLDTVREIVNAVWLGGAESGDLSPASGGGSAREGAPGWGIGGGGA